MTGQTIAGKVEPQAGQQPRPKVRISLVEKNDRAFLRIEYQDYTPIAQALERRGFQRYRTERLFGSMRGEAYRYTSEDYIVPRTTVRVKAPVIGYIDVDTIDDINQPAIIVDEYSRIIVNFAIFRAVPSREGDIYVTEAPIDASFVPCVRALFASIVRLWQKYLSALTTIKRVRFNVEFW